MFGPRGAAPRPRPMGLCSSPTRVIIVLLVWRQTAAWQIMRRPMLLIGQADFFREGRNGKGEPPLRHSTCRRASRRLRQRSRSPTLEPPRPDLAWPAHCRNQPADIVLGQADFTATLANRGGEPRADTLNWCYGVALAGPARSSANRQSPRAHLERNSRGERAPADLVLGQTDMTAATRMAGEASTCMACAGHIARRFAGDSAYCGCRR